MFPWSVAGAAYRPEQGILGLSQRPAESKPREIRQSGMGKRNAAWMATKDLHEGGCVDFAFPICECVQEPRALRFHPVSEKHAEAALGLRGTAPNLRDGYRADGVHLGYVRSTGGALGREAFMREVEIVELTRSVIENQVLALKDN